MRWRNPVFCKRLLYDRLKHAGEPSPDARPLQFNLAWLERWCGKFDAAAALADQAFLRMDRDEDPEGWSELLVVKSVCVYSLGELSQADEILGQSIEILGPAAHGRAGIEPLTVLANMSAYYHDYEKARAKLQEAMAISERLDLVFERAHILQTLSRAELRCGSAEAALEAGRASLEISLKHRNRVNLPYAYEVLGAALVETGDLKAGRQSTDKGLAAARISADTRVACHLHYVAGHSLFEEGRFDAARTDLETGLKTAADAGYHHWTRNFYLKLSQTHERLEDYKNALGYLKAYMELQKKMFTEEVERQSNEFRNRLEYRLAHSKADYEREVRTRTEDLNKELREANQALRDLNTRVEHNALHDALTGIGNRRMMAKFFDTAQKQFAAGTRIAAVLIDLDRFKSINDHDGHTTGDIVIKTVARRLAGLLLETETLIRIGGDEFLILTADRTSQDVLAALTADVIREINRPVAIKGDQTKTVGASAGASVREVGPHLEHELLKTADEAMYQAKKTGRNRYCLHASVGALLAPEES